MELSRRNLLQVGGLSALAVAGLTIPLNEPVAAKSASELDDGLMPRPYGAGFVIPPTLQPVATGVDALGPFSSYVIEQRAGSAVLLPSGQASTIWGYNGLLPGPTIHAEAGSRTIVRMRNRLPATHPLFGHAFETSTHLHGNASLPQYDGYASDLTPPGYAKTYQYPNSFQPARTLWYHDHAVHNTAPNVYTGLLGQYHVHDPVERDLLPQRPFDVPMILGDVMFAEDGGLGYDDRDHSGLWGDVIVVNGVPWPVMKVQRRVYRFRVLNASVSRSYRLTLTPQSAMHVVGTDGGMVPTAQETAQLRIGSAERYEILIDFAQFAPGQRVELHNLSNENNRDFDDTDKVMAFDVVGDPVDTTDPTWNRIPSALASSSAMSLRRDQAVRRRRLRLQKSDVTNEWSINGRTWHDVIDSGFREVFANPGLNDVEIWEIENRGGGWFHPVHIHLVDFQILSRNGRPPFNYERGPKDVVYVAENEKVEVIMKFGPHRGKYMIHCHNLPHEDHDMMTQFSVGLVEGQVDVNDPINADPARPDTEASSAS